MLLKKRIGTEYYSKKQICYMNFEKIRKSMTKINRTK